MILLIEIVIGLMWLGACGLAYRTRKSRPRNPQAQTVSLLQEDKDAAQDNYENYSEYNGALRTWFVTFGLGALVLFMLHPEFVELLKRARQFSIVVILFLAGCFLQVLVALVNKFAAWQVYHAKLHGEDAHHFWEHLSEFFFLDELVDISTVGAFALAIAIMVMAFVFSPASSQADSQFFQKPTATEVFNLRSRCAEQGDKLLQEQRAGIGPALYADAKSHYDTKTNRCYVEVDVSTADLTDPKWTTTQRLYDGQTKENLAWFETRGPAHADEDKCMEYLGMPINRTCQQINDKISEIMTDTRKN